MSPSASTATRPPALSLVEAAEASDEVDVAADEDVDDGEWTKWAAGV